MGSVIPDPVPRYGIIRGKNYEFFVEGDLRAAYEALKEMFEPKASDTSSGPIRPLTAAERKLEANKPVADMLENLPPSEY